MKAGLMEIAHIFVVNKSDREGADRMARAIDSMLELSMPSSGAWAPPVLRTTASTGAGVPELAAALDRHRAWLVEKGLFERRRRERVAAKIGHLVDDRLRATLRRGDPYSAELARWTDEVIAGRTTPHRAAAALFDRFGTAHATANPGARSPEPGA
jgi:LAO/AO transport system kinase